MTKQEVFARLRTHGALAADLDDLLAAVATWPEEWQDSFAEREAIMAIDASRPYVPAIREAFKDVVRVANRAGCELNII